MTNNDMYKLVSNVDLVSLKNERRNCIELLVWSLFVFAILTGAVIVESLYLLILPAVLIFMLATYFTVELIRLTRKIKEYHESRY